MLLRCVPKNKRNGRELFSNSARYTSMTNHNATTPESACYQASKSKDRTPHQDCAVDPSARLVAYFLAAIFGVLFWMCLFLLLFERNGWVARPASARVFAENAEVCLHPMCGLLLQITSCFPLCLIKISGGGAVIYAYRYSGSVWGGRRERPLPVWARTSAVNQGTDGCPLVPVATDAENAPQRREPEDL